MEVIVCETRSAKGWIFDGAGIIDDTIEQIQQ